VHDGKVLYCLSHTSNPFILGGFLRQGLAFGPGQSGWQAPVLGIPPTAGVAGSHHHAQFFSIEMGSHKLLLDWSRTVILLSSASHVA
jgi:hypothetical protein